MPIMSSPIGQLFRPDVCLYHRDADGFGAAYAVWKKYGDKLIYVSINYNEDISHILEWRGRKIIMVDFSLPKDALDALVEAGNRIVILDHHASAQKHLKDFHHFTDLKSVHKYHEHPVEVYFDMDKAGCKLAWEYCNGEIHMPKWLQSLDDRDLWKFDLPHTKEVCAAIMSYPKDFKIWDEFDFPQLIKEGKAILRARNQVIRQLCKTARIGNFGGYTAVIVDCIIPQYASDVASKLLSMNKEAHICIMAIHGENQIEYSLRSRKEEEDKIRVNDLAEQFGGGGHPSAAGFVEDKKHELPYAG